ncbi:MAG: T9SS type A sorting domain-containing protein [Flavobacteriales bacterium]|nr:T9SS type A sorting domain-containing protein [Flavobacteriia bacterium]NCP05015.1 T9SS type A sorting domain-containing protein [Flavobacteriales bacterium]PIV94225.1 MAG: hypothetical protein COW44_05355 [Flavobacteriaceae bacterium CG17_big_fil_post_rev_8_21_14_2_50_33_15]PIY10730.1 MAG: hypothetical protein COZ17_09030 [Flavobacteriaceae bacterium CG_4_10_14_3_um_filter_33_47]PJB19400.1 MAG: hypothetical protein CO117_04740 [Flavobacteriaceae bacterium CG_4_9_14_3_um_filter_33_16]
MKNFFHRIKSSLFSILLLISYYVSSQNNVEPVCGTVTSKETLHYFNTIKPQLKNFQLQFNTSKSTINSSKSITKNYIPIKAHVIRLSNGEGGLTEYDLNNAIADINQTFANAYMEFFLCKDINYIDSDRYFHFKSSEEKTLVEANYETGVINIYFTDHIKNSSDESICGYTYNKSNYDVIMMQNDCATNNSSLAHELGHYFSLIHTHGADNLCKTKELVNSSNCSSEGDQICDTPADPKLTSTNINNFCRYIGDETDVNGELFNPDTKNIMSYSMKGCRSHFSQEQFSRMYAYYMTEKSYLACGDASDIDEIVEVSNASDIKIYPNPISGDVLYIKSNTADTEFFEISNLMGQVFVSGKVTSNEPVHVNHLSSGTYLLTIKSKSSKISKRLIK